MAPPVQPLPDDLIPEILLRIRPDDPASIARSSAVCKAWRRILADPAFSGSYRALHHWTAPVLGFLHNPRDHEAPRFVPTAPSFRLPTADHHKRHVLDCRHGRVVLYDYEGGKPLHMQGYQVWDPITGDQHIIPGVMDAYTNAEVICTAGDGGCDHHRSCGGGPFIVAFAGVEYDDYGWMDAHAEFYSSETRGSSLHVAINLDYKQGRFDLEVDRPAALVGDSLYFVGTAGILLRYWYGPVLRLDSKKMIPRGMRSEDILSVIQPPAKRLGRVVVMTAEGGGLGLACLNLNRITMWAREETGGPKGDAAWVRRRSIDLRKLIPIVNPKRRAFLSGAIPGDARVIFVSTEDGVFRIELETLQVTKVSDMGNDVKIIYPFVSFYTETLLQRLASGKLPAPVGNM